ncbi:MAG: hypothetical protein EZS28_010196 [Streblomastix strix]|uniref:Uncharacterized protein n=1 Tax=Streblomastix strix TaxID=222440 RepID=A0A5J4WH32_9EUKA|nr:MAG: hypothetical protein EZS28_010196 [Streblomastix strix]
MTISSNELSRQAAVTLITVAGCVSVIGSIVGIGLLVYFCRWWRLRQIRLRQENYRLDKLQHRRLGDLRNPIRLGATQDSGEQYKYIIKDDENDKDEEDENEGSPKRKKLIQGSGYDFAVDDDENNAEL